MSKKTSTVQPKRTNSSWRQSAGGKTCDPSKPISSETGSASAGQPMKGWLLIKGKRVPIATRTAYQEHIGSLLDLHGDYLPLEPLPPTSGPLMPEKLKRQPYDELYLKQKRLRDL